MEDVRWISSRVKRARCSAPQELLYSRRYWYKSGINDTIKIDLKNRRDGGRIH